MHTINPHVCLWCGTSAWTGPALDRTGRPCLALSIHLTPDGALCGRGGFAVDEPEPTPERQRKWCAWAMHGILSGASGEMIELLALGLSEGLLDCPPAAAISVAGECHAAVEKLRAEVIGVDEEWRRNAQRTTDSCRALATVTDLTWDDVDPDRKIRARLEIVAKALSMEAAEQEARAEDNGPLFGKRERGQA